MNATQLNGEGDAILVQHASPYSRVSLLQHDIVQSVITTGQGVKRLHYKHLKM
jgi:hypothetical protein